MSLFARNNGPVYSGSDSSVGGGGLDTGQMSQDAEIQDQTDATSEKYDIASEMEKAKESIDKDEVQNIVTW